MVSNVLITITLFAFGTRGNLASAYSYHEHSTVRCIDDSDGSGIPNMLYRLTNYGKTLRAYPNPQIADSWTKHEWHKNIEDINCSKIAIGKPMLKRPDNLFEYDTVYCVGDDIPGEVGDIYRFTDDELRLYPSYAIASQWDPEWESNAKGIDCTGLNVGDVIPAYPTGVQEGDPIQCVDYTNDAALPPRSVFRFMNGMLRHYSSGVVAFAYDEDWHVHIEKIDCTGYKTGAPLYVLPEDLSEGDTMQCEFDTDGFANPNKVYRFTDSAIHWYDRPSIATSWDPNWFFHLKAVDCNDVHVGDRMPMKTNA